jgi:pyruvate/2-oxoglutarate/acetoin dehydrogenase E1 component
MKKTMRDAIKEAISEEMQRDQNVFLIGEDVGAYGGTLQVTAGIFEKFGPERVLDTPISEIAIAGAACGAAMLGMRPIAEIMFADFLYLAADQLINNAAKMCYASAGQVSVPMVVRAPFGAGTRSGMHHCQSNEIMFINTPGIKVVMPSNAYDAKGLLKASVRDNDPVVFYEHKMLYGTRSEIPDEDYIVALGKADIKRQGSDVTIVAWGSMVTKALDAAGQLTKQGIECEVVDPRTLKPLDSRTIVESVIKTGRLVIAHEANLTGGFGGEIAAIVAKDAFGYLDAPIVRVAAPDTPVPFNPGLEDAYIPSVQEIVAAVKSLF